jgi:hypothetical protein
MELLVMDNNLFSPFLFVLIQSIFHWMLLIVKGHFGPSCRLKIDAI